MKLSIKAGSTSETVNVFVRDSSSTTGAGLTGLVFNSSGLTAYYALPKAAAVSITLATLAAVTSAYSSGGFKEIDATNMPGWYRLDVPDAALASGRFVSLHLKGVTNMAALPVEIELTATNNQSATSFITAVNGIAQTGDSYARLGAPAGASISADIAAVKTDTAAVKTQTDKLTFTVANQIDANVLDWKSATAPAMTGDAYARLGAPAGLSVSADVAAVKADTAAVKTQTDKLTFTVANQVDSNVLDWKSATAPAMTGDAFARLGAPAGASVSADVAAVKTDTAAIGAKTTNLPASPAAVSDIPTANACADALLDRTAGVETSWTVRQAMRIILAALGGKLAGAATSTVTVRDMADAKNRISATVDANGNRSAVILDAS